MSPSLTVEYKVFKNRQAKVQQALCSLADIGMIVANYKLVLAVQRS